MPNIYLRLLYSRCGGEVKSPRGRFRQETGARGQIIKKQTHPFARHRERAGADVTAPSRVPRLQEVSVIKNKKRSLLCVLLLAVLVSAYCANLFGMRRCLRAVGRTGMVEAEKLCCRLAGKDVPVYVPVLMYHSVSDTPIGIPALSVKPADFDRQMQLLRDDGFTPICFPELARAGDYKKPVLITFDDGYYDNYSEAYPILKKYGFHATVFMVSGNIGAPNFLNGSEILEMSDLVSFQSHTVHHYRLPDLDRDSLDRELSQSKAAIEALTKKPVVAISYPEGHYSKAVLKLVPKYYDYAVTTKYGYWRDGMDRYQIRRLAIGRDTTLKCFSHLVSIN